MEEPTAGAPSFEIKEMAAKEPKWRLILKPEAFLLEPLAGGDPVGVTREERVERVDTMNGLYLRRMLSVKVGKKNRLFKLDPAGWEALVAWIGPPTLPDLRKALKRRLGWIWPLGVLMIVAALPLAADPDRGFPGKPLDSVGCALGGALILMGLVSRFVPNRIFFLLDCVWVGIAAWTTIQLLLVQISTWQVVILLLQISVIKGGLREFARFGGMTEDLESRA